MCPQSLKCENPVLSRDVNQQKKLLSIDQQLLRSLKSLKCLGYPTESISGQSGGFTKGFPLQKRTNTKCVKKVR